MSDYFVGEIRLFAINYAPVNWAPCQGQLLSIQQNSTLFSLIGTQFGGNGVSTFALPDLRGRTPYGTSATLPQGAQGGNEVVTLTLQQLPPHTHGVLVNSAPGTTPLDTGDFLAANAAGAAPGANAFNAYATPGAVVPLHSLSVTSAGASGPHENRQPSLALEYCIALNGIYPSRS